jgi:putative peptide zinc metalloprotease protein
MTPRLRPHVQITRQHYRGQRWHVVQDPTSNQFYRLNPIAYEFVAMLDGRREVEEVWQTVLERHGDAAPTQQEIVELLGQLYNSNLLSVDSSPEVEQLLRRGKERFKKKAAQQAIGIMYFRTRLFNPDGMLAAVEPIFRPIINKWGFLVWAAFVASGFIALLGHWDELFNQFENTIDPGNWGWLAVVFVVSKAIHESGHGIITKRFGGQVPEFGMMLLVLFPAPYVDASSAWAMPSKWRRIAIGAGGMIFELALATVAVYVWLATAESNNLIHQIAYNAMFTASVSTVLFNANPLMRFDGYYILSDLLEVPNMAGRATNLLKFLFQRHVYRLKDIPPPPGVGGERTILLVYGVLALMYRIFLFFSITLFVMTKMFAIGLVLAIWTAAAWFILPGGKFIHWHAAGRQVADCRGRAILTTLAMVFAAVVLFGMIPFADHRYAWGVVESEHRSGVYFGVAGFVTEAHARPGDFVRKDEPILTCENPDLRRSIRQFRSRIEELRVIERGVMGKSQIAVKITQEHIKSTQEGLASLLELDAKLVVRAPHDGVIVGSDPAELVGAYVSQGENVCSLVDLEDVHIVAALSTAQIAPLRELENKQVPYKTSVRRVSYVSTVIPTNRPDLEDPEGLRSLSHPGLGMAGGGDIPVDPRDQTGLRTKSPTFRVTISVDEPRSQLGLPGERVRVRFTLPDKPLMTQWWDRLRKLVQGRVNL